MKRLTVLEKFGWTLRLGLLSCAVLLISAAAQAETRALLIGVSGYPALPAAYRLDGPRNDVTAIAGVLRTRGVRDITVLADGLSDSKADPTRSAILEALSELARRMTQGDWAVVYFSGHGSQQPQPAVLAPGTYREPDGLDEIFLPLDASRWDARAKTVANSLIDDEIGRALGVLLRRGASVWAIFDTCHAGDMAKSLPTSSQTADRRVWRIVPPSVLGVPPIQTSSRSGKKRRHADSETQSNAIPAPTGQGQLVAFYATQPDEPAPEEPLLPGTGSKRMIGVFTWHLVRALNGAAGPRPSFETVMQGIVASYRADRRPFPTPLLEGPGHLPLPF